MVSPLRSAPFVLLDDSRPSQEAGDSLFFTRPSEIIRADTYAEVMPALAALDAAVERGQYAAGFIAYECGLIFEAKLCDRLLTQDGASKKANEPLIWLMVCDAPTILNSFEVERLLKEAQGGNRRSFGLDEVTPFQSASHYRQNFLKILSLIEAGDVYQVNYTGPVDIELQGDPLSLYEELRSLQPVSLGAFIDSGEDRILSLSPEQFIKGSREKLETKPMKGTAGRGRFLSEDVAIKADLQAAEKTRAENLMIVDLIRNDLSRVACSGSVEVSSLFDVETLPSVHQMTSTVVGVPKAELAPSSLLAAMFPCGSVTGAPKIRAMEIIADLEMAPRGVYCGAIGYFGPMGRVSLNVPIRTLIFDKENAGRLHIGSGVVADSDSAAEYSECLLKAKFIQPEALSNALIETMVWTQAGGFSRLDLHLDRLENSMTYLGARAPVGAIREQLKDLADTLTEPGPWRVRLLADTSGAVSVEANRHEQKLLGDEPLLVAVAAQRVSSTDPRLFHKFADRDPYTKRLNQTKKAHPEVFDCLLVNERDEITEGSFTNVFADFGDGMMTPPIECGLLPGVLRQSLIASGKAREGILRTSDLDSAKALYVGNSLRGLIPVRRIPE